MGLEDVRAEIGSVITKSELLRREQTARKRVVQKVDNPLGTS